MKAKLIIVTALLALSACASQPAPTLDQKLSEATTPADRKETLRLACLNEAEWPVKSTKNPYRGRHATQRRMEQLQRNPEVREMKSLCRQMDDLTTTDAEEKLSPKQLVSSCAELVSTKKAKERKGGADHAMRVEQICKKMTSAGSSN